MTTVFLASGTSFMSLGLSLLMTSIGRNDRHPFWVVGGLCLFVGFAFFLEALWRAKKEEQHNKIRQTAIDKILNEWNIRDQHRFDQEKSYEEHPNLIGLNREEDKH